MRSRPRGRNAPPAETRTESELPPAFLERMAGMLGDELPAFLAALGAPDNGLRVNTLRLSPADFVALAPFRLAPLGFPRAGFTVEADSRPGRHPYHAAGLYYLQDPGAMMVGELVGAAAGERVLDLSAAPGGKATQLAAAMGNAGLLVANDVSRPRAMELVGNLERCGVRNAIVTSESVERLVAHFGAWFDRVLVDAPCSGEAMFHKSAAARLDWSIEVVHGCARRQADLILSASLLVRPGGLLVYSTCTFSRNENEEVIERFLTHESDFELEELPAAPEVDGSIQRVRLAGTAEQASSPAAYRLWPHRVAGAGHFVAALRRVGGDAARGPQSRRATTPRDVLRLYRDFLGAVYPHEPVEPDRIEVRGSRMHELPPGAPSTEGLHVLRTGLDLGSLRTDRFEPAHAMVMAIPPTSASNQVNLEADDPRIERYLSGHPIEVAGDPGWVPVCVDGYALGWGKRVGTIVKNHYPKGLRRPG